MGGRPAKVRITGPWAPHASGFRHELERPRRRRRAWAAAVVACQRGGLRAGWQRLCWRALGEWWGAVSAARAAGCSGRSKTTGSRRRRRPLARLIGADHEHDGYGWIVELFTDGGLRRQKMS